MTMAMREKFFLLEVLAGPKAAFPSRLVRIIRLYQLTLLPPSLFLKPPANYALKGTFGHLTCQTVSLSRFLIIPSEI